jgi:adenine-specific DNA-methyltransferase
MDTPALRKARGAFFTPSAIASFMAHWAVKNRSDTVLEPSCGEAVFLRQAAHRLHELGASKRDASMQIHGVELHEESAREAGRQLAAEGFTVDVAVGDYFETDVAQRFDAIIGNPPYVRYQEFSGASRAKGLRAALAQGVRLSGLASSWAAFVLHSAGHLKEGGRLAFVLPAELMSVGYANEIRSFLLRRFSKVRIVTFEERVFPGVLEDVVLLLAEGTGGAKFFELHQTRNADTLAAAADGAWTEHSPVAGEKWTSALMAQDAFTAYEKVCSTNFEKLSDWGRTYLGAVTGNNKYFALGKEDVARLGLGTEELIKISQPGSRHLHGLEFTESAWRAELADGARSFLFYPGPTLSGKAKEYVDLGAADGVNDAYKCRMRQPWWRVPLVETPDLFLTYMNHDRPRLVTNSAKVQILNSLYGIALHSGRKIIGRKLLPVACLNSITLLGAEIVGRAYGGGLLKLEPREADMLPIPSLGLIAEKQTTLEDVRPQLASYLRRGNVAAATSIVDGILLSHLTTIELDHIRLARDVLFQRRKVRGAGG